MDNALFLVVQEFYASPRYMLANGSIKTWEDALVAKRYVWSNTYGTREEEPESEAKGEKEEDDGDEEIDDVEDD
ncbi:hypothetical protein Golob_000015 [Gossypium lobatum]|uniref:Uncharacterized protein n=1 Tax=Gossypium lobatum TaxID=34289 RepID=A0A7J8NJJ9_9ROSI|nr:hypothetical protein [Gossypium lobatum]